MHLFKKIKTTTIYAERSYSPNFSIENKVFCLSLHYNSDNSYLFVNCKEVVKFKAKNSEVKPQPIALGSTTTTEYLSIDEIKESKLYGNVYDFSVDYSAILNDKIHDIGAYLMKKNGIIKMSEFIKKVNYLECVSLNNQVCKIRPEIISLKTNKPVLYSYSIKINKCKGSCSTINDPYAKICVPHNI